MAGLNTITESGTELSDTEGFVLLPQKSAHKSNHPVQSKEASVPKSSMKLADGPCCHLLYSPLFIIFVHEDSPEYSESSMYR